MQDFADMAEAHEWTLRRLREMAGRLTEQAYLRASDAAALRDDEAHARWMLVFDRMARGLRLSIALEARLARERRWDADEALREAQGQQHEPRWRRPAGRGGEAASGEGAAEGDAEREADDDDGLPAGATLARRLGRLKAIIEGAGASEPPPPRLGGAERRALAAQRVERARRAASRHVPDEPWDVLGGESLALDDVMAEDLGREDLAGAEPPWRGAG